MTQTLPKPITEYIEAANTYDGDRLIAAFADDALVNDARREFWGTDAIKRWSDQEVIGDKVTMDVKNVKEHYGDFVVDALVEGEPCYPRVRIRYGRRIDGGRLRKRQQPEG